MNERRAIKPLVRIGALAGAAGRVLGHRVGVAGIDERRAGQHQLAAADGVAVGQVQPQRVGRFVDSMLAPVTAPEGGGPIPFSQQDLAFSPDGTVLASATGTDQVTLWNVTDPARAYRLATVGGLGDFIQAFTFSPRGNLLGAVTYHGAVLVYSLADPARPARTATVRTLLTRAFFPSGLPRPSETPLCDACSGLGDYAVAFAVVGSPPGGHGWHAWPLP
jgi:hypothetical protein